MAAAAELGQLLVGHIFDELGQLGIFAEELFANVAAGRDDVFLVFAVDHFAHALDEEAAVVFFEQSSQSSPQTTLMTFQPAPRKTASSS